MTKHSNSSIAQAMASVAAATPRAAADPTRPVYHFCPPAYWMNDPNGTIYHNGYYQLFYQHNPYGDDWGHMHWGHARSRDLVQWEHLPIALWPSLELGEEHVFSGCARVNGQGQPMLFYTSVKRGPRENRPPNEQWAAIGDPDWITWQKHPANPILSVKTHGGPRFEDEWRDPFIFAEAGRTFMVVGGTFDYVAGVALYEAEDDTLARWRYCGLLFQEARSKIRFFECPNFFKVDGKWMLLTSPYKPIEYVVGAFDVRTLTFAPASTGILDPGFSDVPNFYASNILYDEQGRCILLGWVRGFAKERGWNGALALPRILTIGPDGHPRQAPVPQLQQLRDRHVRRAALNLNNSSYRLDDLQSDTCELLVTIQPGSATAIGLNVRCSADRTRVVRIGYADGVLDVAGTPVPVKLMPNEPLKLHLFLDRSVLELFVNDGKRAITRVIDAPVEDLGIELFAKGEASVVALDVWTLKPMKASVQ